MATIILQVLIFQLIYSLWRIESLLV